MRNNFICIEGIIGAGKTTLAKKLSHTFQAKLILEQFKDNPFLPLFYEEPQKHAFALEMSFLAERYHQFEAQPQGPDLFHQSVISDYLFNKCLIFAKANLSEIQFDLYRQFYGIIEQHIPKPDLLLYLYLSPEKALKNIHKRNRAYEQNIETDYLERIQRNYLDFFKTLKNKTVVLLDINEIDFVASENDYQKIIEVLDNNYAHGIHKIVLN